MGDQATEKRRRNKPTKPVNMDEFKITKEQILELAKSSWSEPPLKRWFPEAFETKFEVGKWYKNNDTESIICCDSYYLCLTEGLICKGYGVAMGGGWVTDWKIADCVPATNSEVEAALINEAKKRGFKEWVCINRKFNKGLGIAIIDKKHYPNDFEYFFSLSGNYLEYLGFVVYSGGQWAALIPTMTKQEAEEKLGVKICD